MSRTEGRKNRRGRGDKVAMACRVCSGRMMISPSQLRWNSPSWQPIHSSCIPIEKERKREALKEMRLKLSGKRRSIPLKVKRVVLERQKECQICGSLNNLQIDHILPVSLGGTNDLDNLRVLCRQCNMEEWARHFKRVYNEVTSRYGVPNLMVPAVWLRYIPRKDGP